MIVVDIYVLAIYIRDICFQVELSFFLVSLLFGFTLWSGAGFKWHGFNYLSCLKSHPLRQAIERPHHNCLDYPGMSKRNTPRDDIFYVNSQGRNR